MANPFGEPDANRSIQIYVPSTVGEIRIPDRQWNGRVDVTTRFLRRLFGGTTSVVGQGTWKFKGKNIEEPVWIVETMTNDADIKRHNKTLVAWVRERRKEWKQKSLSVKYEEDMSWYK